MCTIPVYLCQSLNTSLLPSWAWQNWNNWSIDFHGSSSSEKDEMPLHFNHHLLAYLLAGKWSMYFFPYTRYAPVWTRIFTALPSLTMATYVKNAELNRLGLNVLEVWRGGWSLAVHQRTWRHSEADSSCSLGLIQRGFSSHRIKLFTVWFPSCRSWEDSGSVQDTKSHKQVQSVYEFLRRWQQMLLLFQMCNAVGPDRHHS